MGKKFFIIPFFFILAAVSCDLDYEKGTILDAFIDDGTEQERSVVDFTVSATSQPVMVYGNDGTYSLSGLSAFLVYDDGSVLDVSGEVSVSGLPFSKVGLNTITVNYDGYSKTIEVDTSSFDIQIQPRSIDNDFFIPEEYGADNSGMVFVGWAALGTDEILSFPVFNESYDSSIVITPVFKPVRQVFELDDEKKITKVLEPYYEFYGIPSDVTALGDAVFYGNKTVKAVAFEDGSELSVIGSFAFYSSSLQYFEMPSSLQEIKDSAFSVLVDLKKIIWEDEPGLKKIGRNAFTGYPLPVFEIPPSVETIERSIIGPSQVESIVFLEGSKVTSIDKYAFDYTFNTEIVFIRPDFETLPEYASSGWGAYMATVRVER